LVTILFGGPKDKAYPDLTVGRGKAGLISEPNLYLWETILESRGRM
jgi:hypothetical protein